MQKKFRVREICSTWIYTVDEAAATIGSCTRTIRNWVKHEDLPVFFDKRPFGILGTDLKKFILRRRVERRFTLRPTEFYCFRCKCPRGPRSDRVLKVAGLGASSRMVAICKKCGSKINRSVKRSDEPLWDAVYVVRKDHPQSPT
jgi:hypothetical protein